MGKLSSSVLEMQHGRARGRVSGSKALGLRCGSRSQLRAIIPCLLLLRVRVNIYICGWMDGYILSGSEIPLAWNCRRWSSFSLPSLPLSPPLSPPSLSHYRDCCVCVNSFSFLWFSEAQHSTTEHNKTQHNHGTSIRRRKRP